MKPWTYWTAAIVVLALLGAASVLRKHPPPPPSSVRLPPVASPSQATLDPLDPSHLELSTSDQADERVKRVFPHGPSTEDVRAQIGRATPPPESEAPNGASSWIATITLAKPATAAEVQRAEEALPPSADGVPAHWVKGHSGSEHWVHVADAEATTTFDRVAVILDLLADGKAITARDVARESLWARSLAKSLGSGAPVESMTPAAAVAKAADAIAMRQKYSDDDLEIGVVIVAPDGEPFAGRKVWDVMYSAGFTWGDGEYFHWVPSPTTDVSQGISVGTGTDPGYFLPESLASGPAEVVSLDMSFSVARTWQPTEVLDVMVRAAEYGGKRLGGTLRGSDGSPFDARAVRARVAAIDKTLNAHGVVPGSDLALTVF